MEQGTVAAPEEECFSVAAEEGVAEEVVTSSETAPQTAPPQQPVYNIPTLIASPGPIMQVVTLQTAQQQNSPQVGLTNALRNIRLIAIQPKLPFNGTNGRTIAIQSKPEIKIQPNDNTKKVAVNNFYSKLKPSQPISLAPKPVVLKPQMQQVKPSPSYYKEQQREREMKEFSHLNEELQRGLRIFLDLTTSLHHATIWPFMERVDPFKDGAPDYDQVVVKPMWLNLIKDKFRQNEYKSIIDFVSDMRLILENCYRYNGPNHPITKKALRLEQCLEQKLALLPSDLRNQCNLPEAAEKKESTSDAYFSVLLHRVRHEREAREQQAKEKKAEEQRLRREEKERQRCLWADRMMNPEVKGQMKTMWEIPQIGHFLHLARGALHIGEIAQYELEHMFLMPEASALLATLMTSLLSSPNQRIKLAELPPTPYAIWSARISSRVAEWYRTYNREARQIIKVHELLGLEPMFWRVCGETNPLEGGKLYHQLSFLKRVWVFKALCDTVAHSHKTVQEAMAEEEGPETRQVTLGQDANGYTYLHFPAVSGSDIRVYRQKSWDLDADPLWGPIVEERRIAEEERVREEELKEAELRKRKRPATAAKKATPQRKSPAKKRTPAKIVNTTPAPQRRQSAPSRIGTRVSPRTLQRQTGLTLYKDSSEESEEEESNEESEEEEEAVEEEVQQVVQPAAQRRRGGRRARGRKKPVRKKLQKIDEEEIKEEMEQEEPEEVINEDEEIKEEEEKTSPLPNGVKEEDQEIKSQPLKGESPVKEEEENSVKEEEEIPVKEEEEGSTPPPTQRFTVSQLMQKLSSEPEETVKEAEPKVEEPKDSSEEKTELETDVDRASYDPFFFELIISSVEELQEWINRFSDDDSHKTRPRCEIKLRERLQSLLDEAQPLAGDQQKANEKICQQLWKEWERHRCSKDSSLAAEESDLTQDSGKSGESGSEVDEEGDSSEYDNDGVRQSRRLRERKRTRQNGSHQSTRSSSPIDDDHPAKQSRKSSYNYDPGWDDSDPSPEPGKRKASFIPEMKNPGYWIGRRVTRATAGFVADSEEPEVPVEKSPPPNIQSEQLIDQLRQLRRQQVLLSSNDPRPKQANGSPAVFLPARDGQTMVRITNPKAAELLTRLRMTRPPAPRGIMPAQPRKIFIQLRPALGQSTAAPASSIEITQPINQAVERGLIVAHEPRSISMNLGASGQFIVTAQMTAAGPRVLSATPVAKKMVVNPVAPVNTESDLKPVSDPVVNETSSKADPESTEPMQSVPLVTPSIPETPEAPSNPVETVAPTTLAAPSSPIPDTLDAVPSNLAVPSSPIATQSTPSAIPIAAPSTPVAAPSTPVTNGTSPRPANDSRQILSADILREVVGPEAVGARLTIVKEGNAKLLSLILSNGETRRLTNTQVQQIQAAIRIKTTTKTTTSVDSS